MSNSASYVLRPAAIEEAQRMIRVAVGDPDVDCTAVLFECAPDISMGVFEPNNGGHAWVIVWRNGLMSYAADIELSARRIRNGQTPEEAGMERRIRSAEQRIAEVERVLRR